MAPSTASAEFSVAWKVCPWVAVSESIGSTNLTAKVVPEGMVTFCGGGGGGGGGGAGALAQVLEPAAVVAALLVRPRPEPVKNHPWVWSPCGGVLPRALVAAEELGPQSGRRSNLQVVYYLLHARFTRRIASGRVALSIRVHLAGKRHASLIGLHDQLLALKTGIPVQLVLDISWQSGCPSESWRSRPRRPGHRATPPL